ncbi:DsbA family protein [Pseudomonas frederiksbergensis]|uniref:DsbA family protein n=1 Tax=Pseudomonas frederiksbergensis TaxID=104087 RepID=UPI003D1CCD76
MKLIYVADPMCSWCYGFGKELTELMKAFADLTLEIRVGGVRAGDTSIMTEEMKQFRLSHWARVETVSGLNFNRQAFIALKNFAYNTEPVCRAIVTAREMVPGIDLLSVFCRVQEAFYALGLDTTDGEVLATVTSGAMAAVGADISAELFLQHWGSTNTKRRTQEDFLEVRSWGVNSFPALILESNGQLSSVAPGYASAEELKKNLLILLDRVGYRSAKTA